MRKNEYEIVFENEDYLAVDKISGISVIPERFGTGAQSLKDLLEFQLNKDLYTVHRIDKDTSGLVIFALNAASHKHLSQLFENHQIKKEYLLITDGYFAHKNFHADYPLSEGKKNKMIVDKDGKKAETDFELLEEFRDYAYLKAEPLTGRTHQIRVHLSFTGVPILCDPLYGLKTEIYLSSLKKKNFNLRKGEEERPLLSRLALHAHALSFEDKNSKLIEIKVPLHKDMRAMLNQLKKHNQPFKESFFG